MFDQEVSDKMYAKTMVTVLTVLVLAVPAGASGNATPGSCGEKYDTVPLGSETLYVVHAMNPNTGVTWFLLYLESNAVDDLQRGGTDPAGNADWCQSAWHKADTFAGLLF